MKKSLILAWSISLFTIPLFSLYGRPLQVNLMAQVETRILNGLLAMLFLGAFSLFLVTLWRVGSNRYAFNLFWVVPVMVYLYSNLPFVEKIHIGLFALFGFLSHRLFGLKRSLAMGFTIACLDELLQHYLASRVGDWRDVRLNLLSVSFGIFLGLLLASAKRGREPDTSPAES